MSPRDHQQGKARERKTTLINYRQSDKGLNSLLWTYLDAYDSLCLCDVCMTQTHLYSIGPAETHAEDHLISLI